MQDDLLNRLGDHLRETRLVPEPGLALLAVSGGPDSVALLDLMSCIASDFGLDLATAHVDHGILPESADVAEQVMGLAVRYGVRGYMSSLGLGADASETRARDERYRVLREVQQRLGARYLVTAHHADDQIETVMYRFLRGTAPGGLAGITAAGPDGLVRPLLPFRKVELGRWLAARGLGAQGGFPIHRDASNLDRKHDRAWVRHELLPVVRSRFGDALDGSLSDVTRFAARDREAWSVVLRALPELGVRVSHEMIEVARDPLQLYDHSLSEALLRAAAREVGCVLGPKRAARLRTFVQRATSGRRQELGQDWVAEIAFGRLRIFRLANMPGSAGEVAVPWEAAEQGSVQWGGWEIAWRREAAGRPDRGSLTTWVTDGPAELRAWRAGDRVFPLGGTGRRRLTRLLMEGRIPRSERSSLPLLVRGDDILWVPGVCRAGVAIPDVGEEAIRVDASANGDS
jgi:tRNA(Ile)-lysidine synthase